MNPRYVPAVQALERGHVAAGRKPDVVEVVVRGASTIAGFHGQSATRVHQEDWTVPEKEWLKGSSCAMCARSA
jgi:hypothetical protein